MMITSTTPIATNWIEPAHRLREGRSQVATHRSNLRPAFRQVCLSASRQAP